mgnify:CR=1 FL=1
MVPLEGKRALITGGAKRMGRSISHALAAEGAHVAVHYRSSEDEAEALAGELRQTGVEAWTAQADLGHPEEAARMLDGVRARTGGLDILVNNASVFPEHRLHQVDWHAIEQNILVNAYAPLALARSFAAQDRPGAIVNLLDTMVADYDRKHVAYHLSKRMLATLTRIMAVEFAPRVRVNAVAPGLVLPPEGKDVSYLEELAHTNLLQAYGAAEDVAQSVVFLCQGDFVTGQTVFVDGGRHVLGKMYE